MAALGLVSMASLGELGIGAAHAQGDRDTGPSSDHATRRPPPVTDSDTEPNADSGSRARGPAPRGGSPSGGSITDDDRGASSDRAGS